MHAFKCNFLAQALGQQIANAPILPIVAPSLEFIETRDTALPLEAAEHLS
jgi:hypothetical protein